MQALYQLSYSPSAVASVRRQRHASVQDLAVSAVVAEHRLGQGAGVVLDEAPPATPAAQDRPGAVRERANHAPEFLGQAEQARGAQAQRCPVADHDGQGARGEGVGDPLQRGTGALGDGGGGLTLGRPPLRMFYRVLRADLGVGEPFPEAAVPLPQVLVRNYRQPGQPG